MMGFAVLYDACVLYPASLRDFPVTILDQFGIEAQHPDEFALDLYDAAPEMIIERMKQHRLSLKNPPRTVDEYLATLEQQSLPKTVSILRGLKKVL